MSSIVEISTSIAKNTLLGNKLVADLYHNRRHKSAAHHKKKAADVQYPLGVYQKHLAPTRELLAGGVVGKDILEIGPGGTVGTALLFLLGGARTATCVDAVPWARLVAGDESELYGGIIQAAAQNPEQNAIIPELQSWAQVDPVGLAHDLLNRVAYWAPQNFEHTELPDASYDLVYSQAVFEHVLHPAAALVEVARLLRPGGLTTHQIDLRDHRDFDRPLEFLRYSDRIWGLASSNSANYVRNRWRRSQYEAECERHGLHVRSVTPTRIAEVDERLRASLHSRFRSLSNEELSQTAIFLVANKLATVM